MSSNPSSVVKWMLSRSLLFRVFLRKLGEFAGSRKFFDKFPRSKSPVDPSLKISNRYFAESALKSSFNAGVNATIRIFMVIFRRGMHIFFFSFFFVKNIMQLQYNVKVIRCNKSSCVLQAFHINLCRVRNTTGHWNILMGSASKYFCNFYAIQRKSNKIKYSKLHQLNFIARFLILQFNICNYIYIIFRFISTRSNFFKF